MEPWCAPCKEEKVEVPGPFEVNGRHYCRKHFAERFPDKVELPKRKGRPKGVNNYAKEETKPPVTFSKHSTLSEMLTDLRARRDAINEAITAIEMAQKVLAQAEELA